MIKIKKIRLIYLISAIIVLLAAILSTVFYVYKGIEAKDNPDIAKTDQASKVTETLDQNKNSKISYQLLIDKISVSAPIIINVDGSDKDAYNSALENGVAHLKGSSLPGKNGNSFIFGHSSYYPDKPGNYKEVFAKLNELSNGDLMEIQSQDIRYIYKITDKKVVQPDDLSVANQNYAIKQLTIMTCWPIGSTDQRLIVSAELVE